MMTEDERADCLKALRHALYEVRKLHDLMADHGIDDIALSLNSLAFEIECAKDDYEPSDRMLPQPSPTRSNGT